MGFYSSQVPDFKQAVEAILAEHGLISDPTDQPATDQQSGQGDQSAGQHADPASQPA